MPPVDQIWSDAALTLESGKPFAMATVINVRGSTPREVGAKMIVHEGGQLGTIGGGCGEAEVFRKARLLLELGQGAGLTEVDLTGDFDQREIGTCGGVMDVFIDLWSPVSDLGAARAMADAARSNLPSALVTLVDAGRTTEARMGARSVLKLDSPDRSALPIRLPESAIAELAARAHESAPRLLELVDGGVLKPVTHIEPTGAPRLFLDPIVGALRLVIIGAGHIAQPLCAIASMLGFHTSVIDDRTSFANKERFPTADEIIARPFVAAIDSLKLDCYCYVVIVTRGHAFDEESLKAVLRQQATYIGMIGSRRRVRATLDRILESARASGIDPAVLDQVHAPIGLDIRAETPEEIAISILAEIIRERRCGTRDVLSLGVKLGRLTPR
jgi:xanthine dehydrogenase accessory factor